MCRMIWYNFLFSTRIPRARLLFTLWFHSFLHTAGKRLSATPHISTHTHNSTHVHKRPQVNENDAGARRRVTAYVCPHQRPTFRLYNFGGLAPKISAASEIYSTRRSAEHFNSAPVARLYFLVHISPSHKHQWRSPPPPLVRQCVLSETWRRGLVGRSILYRQPNVQRAQSGWLAYRCAFERRTHQLDPNQRFYSRTTHGRHHGGLFGCRMCVRMLVC